MHQSLSHQYTKCNCSSCNSYQLALQNDDAFKKVLKVAQKAFKTLYEKKSYNPSDSIEVNAYKELTAITAGVLQQGISHEVPATLKDYLDKDVFVFSGLKTHAQLTEARSFLKDEKGNIRSYDDFERLVTKLNENYNRNYLEAEYLFATNSAQSASNWHQFSDDTQRYYLQYRTASDDRVRDSHRVLHNITLPKDDPFWDYYYTPNGWRCRCQVIEVLANKNTKSNSKEAMAKGEKATTIIGKNGKENKLFQFNPGKTKTVFPPDHAYKKIVGAKEVEKGLNDSYERFVPKDLEAYKKELGITIDNTIFSYLKKETRFTTVNLDNSKSSGAFYNPNENYVKIPIDKRRKASKWYAEAVVYHEFGHAADWQNDFRKQKIVKDLMNKYRDIYSQNDNEQYKKIDDKLKTLYFKGSNEEDFDLMEKVGAVADTLMSLNTDFGVGHSVEYFQRPGFAEAEFLAHTFENRFAGNEVFKRAMPELYADMIQLADDLKPKQK